MRIETVVNAPRDLGCNARLPNLDELQAKARAATFEARGVLICSFVPRPLDFHEQAVTCPYPHSSADVDEVLFYSRGSFTSRRGVGPGSISAPPARPSARPAPGRLRG